jgi:hypothetical protein
MSTITDADLQTLNEQVKTSGYVDREHLMKFLMLIPTNDGVTIVKEVKDWLQTLHNDPNFPTVTFFQGDINAVLGDLDSYGKVSTETIQRFKQNTNKAPAQTT